MRHVITGGSGFVGQRLAERLVLLNEKVVVFDLTPPKIVRNDCLEFIQGDVTSQNDLEKLNLQSDDVIYHLAARQFSGNVPRFRRYEWFEEVNVNGTLNLVKVMNLAGCSKIVFFSTDMTYGLPMTHPIQPNHPQNPLGPYGLSKVNAEKILLNEKFDVTIFRPRLITGHGRLGILNILFKLIRSGLPVPIIGNGLNRYQMVGVDDCVDAALLAYRSGFPRGAFNLGSLMPPTVKDLMKSLIIHAGSNSKLIYIPSFILKPVLKWMDFFSLTLLHKEQYLIADLDILLDTELTHENLGWYPKGDDSSLMKQAYDSAK